MITRFQNLTVVAALCGAIFFSSLAGAGKRELKPVTEQQVKQIADALPKAPTAKPAKPRKVLCFCLCDGFYHKCIPVANKAVELLGSKTGAYETVISQDIGIFTPEKLKEFDAIVFNNTTRMKFTDQSQKKAILDFLKSGKGIVGIHAASDNFYDWPEGSAMMGGLFDGHPWGAGGTWAVKIDEPDHPLCKAFGKKGFLIKDEIYKIKAPYDRKNLRVLVSLDMSKSRNRKGRPDNDNAISWIQEIGKGRVFYCSFGHNNEVFFIPEVLQHYLDGIQYAMGDIQADATPSAKLEKQPAPALCPED